MAEDTTAIEHLLQGRQALEREVARLTEAMDQLDSVIALFNSGGTSGSLPGTSALVRSSTGSGTVNASTAPRSSRRAPVRKAAGRTSRTETSEAPKSIREHVLDMLAADNREFGLAEIIDRIHAAGIQAHDDAVRSITIKLMKDGQVERVGRGQYRLAGAPRAAQPVTEVVEEIVPEPTADEVTVEDATVEDATADDATADEIAEPAEMEQAEAEQAEASDANSDAAQYSAPAAERSPWQAAPYAKPESTSYTPPLNLGQPWS